jgi:1-acyl-sn-glycerol-3-phosphate acyltransferase
MHDLNPVQYKIPLAVWRDLAWAFMLRRHRSFLVDARRILANLRPAMRVLGAEHIPQAGPALITLNHYWAPGFWAPWMSIAVSSVVPVEIYWTMSGALTFPGRRFRRLLRRASESVLQGVARVYRFNSMPPMPPNPREVAARAVSVRRIIQHGREHPDAIIALAPEGGDQEGGKLTLGPEGSGRLALALAGKGMPVYPVGLYEENGCLTLHFGAPYQLTVDTTVPRDEQDIHARRVMMRAIAGLLPERLRGCF